MTFHVREDVGNFIQITGQNFSSGFTLTRWDFLHRPRRHFLTLHTKQARAVYFSSIPMPHSTVTISPAITADWQCTPFLKQHLPDRSLNLRKNTCGVKTSATRGLAERQASVTASHWAPHSCRPLIGQEFLSGLLSSSCWRRILCERP